MISFFYESGNFIGPGEVSYSNTRNVSDIDIIYSSSTLPKLKLMTEFRKSNVSIERVGVLLGEYVIIGELLLLDRSGQVIKIGHSHDDVALGDGVDRKVHDANFKILCHEVLDKWDTISTVDCPHILTHPFFYNYYHFTLELVSKLRHFENVDNSTTLIPQHYLSQSFQRSLLSRCLEGKKLITYSSPVKVCNPLLSTHSAIATPIQAANWVSNKIQLGTSTEGRQDCHYYITRTGTRKVDENSIFNSLLDKYSFKRVDFGLGDLSVDEQIAMLRGARLIVAPHGAGLTNLIYLSESVKLIELHGSNYCSSAFMQLCSSKNIKYSGLICSQFLIDGSMVVDCDQLEHLLSLAVNY